LHALPWGMLPSLRGRPVVVAPSLAAWRELARRRRSQRSKAAFIAGPDLPHATGEVRSIARLYDDPVVLTGKAATVARVLAAIDGASLAHVACHGHFRADSPLFSSLRLADGPLSALELQSLRRAPQMLILSACDLALSRRHPGDELLGVSAALLAMGTRTIVASVIRIPDATARRMMLAFHTELAHGAAPASALARAQASAPVAGFVCLGAG
jgi:CHAT domain-containing protein